MMNPPGLQSRRYTNALLLACLLCAILTQAVSAEPETIPCPNPLNIVADQWTKKNHGAVEIQLFKIEDGAIPEGSQIPLSLRAAVQLAFENNLDIQAQKFDTGIASSGINKAQGVFNTYLFSDATHSASRSGISSAIQNVDPAQQILETTTSYADLGLRKLIQTGTLLEVKLDFNRLKSNSSWLIINPSYTTHLNFSMAHPLLKNGGIAFQTAPIRIAKNLFLISEDRWEAFVTDVLLAVIKAYWDLAFANQNNDLRLKSLQLAKELLRTTEIHVKLGSMAPVDLLQSKTGVALREEELVASGNLLEGAQDILKDLINLKDAPLFSNVLIVPTDPPQPPPAEEEELSLEAVLRMALENRPEYRAAQRELETKNLQIKVAENQLLPSLDFSGTVGLNGLSGTQQPTSEFVGLSSLDPWDQFLVLIGLEEPPQIQSPWAGQWTKSFEEMFYGESTYQWNVGLRFEMPLENTTAKASYRQAKMEAYKSLWNMRSLAQKILLDVKDAWRDLETSRQKILASEATRNLAQQQLEAENKRLGLGLSTSYQVLQMEEDFRSAQIKVVLATAEYWKAKARLHKATGTLLQEEGVLIGEKSSQGNS